MFVSFFPRPRLFFFSALLWAGFAVLLWYGGARHLGAELGFQGSPPAIGVTMFWQMPFLWFDLYYAVAVSLFAAFWRMTARHPWQGWSVLGSALILFVTYLQVEVSVGINRWYGPFYDLIQRALGHRGPSVTEAEYYHLLLEFLWLALFGVAVSVASQFFVSHFIFRWRTAMNEYYVSHWSRLRGIEGASQRIQEDTMRFAATTEDLGANFVNSLITVIAFTPVLVRLSLHISALPVLGDVRYALVWVAIAWSIFGTLFLAIVGMRLPAIEFKNQRVEAAYRKELVYGEDNPKRAKPAILAALFAEVRKNYFSLYLHFVYFNIARFLYLQASVVIAYVALGPAIIAGAITFGLLQRITDAFSQVLSSFQYLVSSWTTIVELQSIYKRLRTFEAQIRDQGLPMIEYSAGPT